MENKNNIVLKGTINNVDYYIYSTKGNDNESYKYYALTTKDNNIAIKDIYNVADYINHFQGNIETIQNNSSQYVRFLALKSYAEKIKQLYDKENKR